MKTLSIAEVVSKGGRSGTIQTADRLLDVTLGNPLEKGAAKRGPSPQRLFAGIMMRHTLMITFLSLAAFAVGCRKESASQQLDKVQEKTKEAARDMKDYTFAQKAEFTEKMQGQLVEINKDLDRLDRKIEKSSDAVKAEIKPKLQALRTREARLNKQLNEVEKATESTWDTVKSGTQKAYDAVEEGFQQSRQWVSDNIAP